MEVVIPYLLIVMGVGPGGEAEVVQRKLAISQEQCSTLLTEEAQKWVSTDEKRYHLACVEFPSIEEFDMLYSANR